MKHNLTVKFLPFIFPHSIETRGEGGVDVWVKMAAVEVKFCTGAWIIWIKYRTPRRVCRRCHM